MVIRDLLEVFVINDFSYLQMTKLNLIRINTGFGFNKSSAHLGLNSVMCLNLNIYGYIKLKKAKHQCRDGLKKPSGSKKRKKERLCYFLPKISVLTISWDDDCFKEIFT